MTVTSQPQNNLGSQPPAANTWQTGANAGGYTQNQASYENHSANDQQNSNAPIGRPIPVVGSDREGQQPLTPWQAAAASGVKPPNPGDCLPGYVDPSLSKDFMKILTRTVYVGGITPNITKEQVRDLFETIVRVDTVTVNYPKFNAFVKLLTRAEAELVKERFHKYQYNGTMLKMGWGCGYGPKEFFDYTTGETLFPMARMTDVERRTITQSGRGGGPIEGGMVVEEPDFGWPQKGEVTKGKYASGQIPYAPGYLAAQAQLSSGGFAQQQQQQQPTQTFTAAPRPFVNQQQASQWPGAAMGVRPNQVSAPGMASPYPGMGGMGMGMAMGRAPYYGGMGGAGRGTEILVVQDRQYDERDDSDRFRPRQQVQDRGEEHVVVLGGGAAEESQAENSEAAGGENDNAMTGTDFEQQSGGPPRGPGGRMAPPPDWPYPPHGQNRFPGGYGMPPPMGMPPGMRPMWPRPPPGMFPGPGGRPGWVPYGGPPPPGGMMPPRKRNLSPDYDTKRDDRRDEDSERRDSRDSASSEARPREREGDGEDGSRRTRSRFN
ncbi:hypothetical protein DFS34DRAFT_73644 [Phlyctochytrium arcticum]|nr:hypothetical protein DFS34DRAFT_73644 [Phlyctochytrium arcticum]